MIVYQTDSSGKYIAAITLNDSDKCPITGNYLIPGGCIETAPPEYDTTTQTCTWINDAWIVTTNPTKMICYYDNGLSYKTVDSTYVIANGEVLFSITPTVAKLSSAFPTVSGARTFTVTTNAIAGDTITVAGVTLTATASTTDSTNFAAGSTVTETVTNIVAALSTNSAVTQLYSVTLSSETFTLTEKIPGNQNTPSEATYTGTITITNNTATTSVYGYQTAYIAQQLVSLNTEYITKLYPVERALVIAYAEGNTDTVTAMKALLASVKAELKTKQEAIIDG